ncbi:hypothetical protein THRCLA_11533 [Thraustotheca clavata]|uniref:Vesicle transport protein n=1 Tax=Thraustotheca clavata TaxID=74557 RepID=A0A1V9Y7F3_9STRA|nr:hypothetical protein THRCLA_11533 [Thraustotheca clavata]
MDRVRIVLGGATEAVSSIKVPGTTSNDSSMEEVSCGCQKLTKKQRMYGFATCFILGYIISFVSTFALICGSRNAASFGILYSLGNIIALCGSGFLVGPAQQIKLMTKPIRRVAAAIYLSMIFVVLAVAIMAPQLGLLILLLALIQFGAAVWYSASYIPYGRKIIASFGSKCMGSMA